MVEIHPSIPEKMAFPMVYHDLYLKEYNVDFLNSILVCETVVSVPMIPITTPLHDDRQHD